MRRTWTWRIKVKMQSVTKQNRTKTPDLTTKPFAMKSFVLSTLFATYSFMAEGVSNVQRKHLRRSYPNNIISRETS